MHQPATSTVAAWASAVLLAVGATSCSSNDGGDPLSTLTDPPTTTTTPASPTSAPTTIAATTTESTATAVTSATPTVGTASLDDLKAQIAADYVRGYQSSSDLLAAPTEDGLDQRIATFALPGSPYFEAVKANILDHVRLHEVTIPGDPPYNSVTVEAVELLGAEPYTSATLTVCRVDNLKRVLPASSSPIGEEILVDGGELNARRYKSHVVLTPDGWLRDDTTAQFDETYVGETTCGVRS